MKKENRKQPQEKNANFLWYERMLMKFSELYFTNWVTLLEKELFQVEIEITVNQVGIRSFWIGKIEYF